MLTLTLAFSHIVYCLAKFCACLINLRLCSMLKGSLAEIWQRGWRDWFQD